MYKKFIGSLVLIGIGCIIFSMLTSDARGQETKTISFNEINQEINIHLRHLRQHIENNTFWRLEYKRYSSSSWTNGNQYLSISRSYDAGSWKFKLTFTCPVPIFSARFVFAFNISTIEYIEGNHSVLLKIMFEDQVHQMTFDYRDLLNVSGLSFSRGMTDGYMWFLFKRDNIPVGTFVFDPVLSCGEYNTQNGYGYYGDGAWTTIRDGSSYSSSTQSSTVFYSYKPSNYRIYRGFCFFDTSALPDDAVISSCKLNYTLSSADAEGCRMVVCVDTDSPYYPSTTMDATDFDRKKIRFDHLYGFLKRDRGRKKCLINDKCVIYWFYE